MVLEWTNPGCPFVQKFYNSGTMQRLQGDARRQGVAWLTINSGAAGKQGHVDAAGAEREVKAKSIQSAAYIPDASGAIGRAYGAKTTPHMYVIDAKGTLVYAGGIDDKPTADSADIKGAKNYVTAALADVSAGRAVSTPTSKPYGCSVKY